MGHKQDELRGLPKSTSFSRSWPEEGLSRFTALDKAVLQHHNVVVMLGEFEYLLIAATLRLKEHAYGAAIREELTIATGKSCSIGALYTTLDRLETKGFVKTWMGESTSQRGGRPKRMVVVTPKGAAAAQDFYAAIKNVSRGIRWAENMP